LIYRLYTYQKSDAKAFVDALHAMMNISGNAAKVKSGFEKFTIKQNDLPDGPWEKTKEIPLDNETTAKESALIIDRPDDWLRRLELWGRLIGYRTEFQRKHSNNLTDTDKTDIVISDVDRFKTTDGATEAFNYGRQLNKSDKYIKSCKEFFKISGMQYLSHELKNSPNIGNDSLMLYFKVSYLNSTPVIMEVLNIMWRRDNLLASIIWMIDDSTIFESKIIQLAKVQDRRIEKTLLNETK